MNFYVQRIKGKKKRKGYPKELLVGREFKNGIEVNAYYFSEECFEREPKDSYQFTVHHRCCVDGAKKVVQASIATLNYYDIAEAYEDKYKDVFDMSALYYRLLSKLDEILKDWVLKGYLSESFLSDDDAVFDRRCAFGEKYDEVVAETKDFEQTEEFSVHEKHRKVLEKYEKTKNEFIDLYGCPEYLYDACYDVFGNLTNPEYLESAKSFSRRREEYSSGKSKVQSFSSGAYSRDELQIMKKFYKILSRNFHPDANPGVDTTQEMLLLNKIKEQLGL